MAILSQKSKMLFFHPKQPRRLLVPPFNLINICNFSFKLCSLAHLDFVNFSVLFCHLSDRTCRLGLRRLFADDDRRIHRHRTRSKFRTKAANSRERLWMVFPQKYGRCFEITPRRVLHFRICIILRSNSIFIKMI